MKLRIKGNSLRLRLSRTEVDKFCDGGYLEDKTDFGNAALVYALQAMDGLPGISADFSEGKIIVSVPAQIQHEWASNETVGYSNTLNLSNGNSLLLLLEKDFKCIDAPPNEDQSDNYENPHQVC